MALLKQSYIQSIYLALDNKYFSVSDFKVELPDAGIELVMISFTHDEKYYFSISEGFKSRALGTLSAPSSESKIPITTECPGNYKIVEKHYHDSFDNCVYRISTWCKNIQDDLRINIPAFKDIEDIKKQLEDSVKSGIENPKDPISATEIETISSRFDVLYAEFEQLKETHKITEGQLQDIRQEFEIIKDNASLYSKGLWANLTSNRLVSLLRKIALSPEGRKLMYEGAKRLFLGS